MACLYMWIQHGLSLHRVGAVGAESPRSLRDLSCYMAGRTLGHALGNAVSLTPQRDEVVLLLEDEPGKTLRFRAVSLADQTVSTIYERAHQPNGAQTDRLWFHQHGERALTGQRIFREAPQPVVAAPQETPRYDEERVRLHPDGRVTDRKGRVLYTVTPNGPIFR